MRSVAIVPCARIHREKRLPLLHMDSALDQFLSPARKGQW